jgi:hypothetical protein
MKSFVSLKISNGNETWKKLLNMTPCMKCLESFKKMTDSERTSPSSTYESRSFGDCVVL